MVMRREQGFRFEILMVMQMFDNCPGNGHTIVGAGSSADLIHENKTSMTQVVEDACGFSHLNHKCRFSACEVVRCADAGKHLINDTDRRSISWDKAADLCEMYNQCCLTQQC